MLGERASGALDAEAAAALAPLCDAYWYPIYAFIRRSGHGPHDTEDLTQGFFARLLEQERITDGNRERFSALRPARRSAPPSKEIDGYLTERGFLTVPDYKLDRPRSGSRRILPKKSRMDHDAHLHQYPRRFIAERSNPPRH